MSQNIFLFTGEEQYLVHQEVMRWKQNFAEKFGPDAVFEYKGDRDPAEAVSSLQGGGLFSTKKLVVLRGVPQDTIASNKIKTHQVQSVFAVIEKQYDGSREGDDVLVLCVSYKPDKRKKEFKWFTKHAEVKLFKPLTGVGLRKRALTQIEHWDSQFHIEQETIDYLLSLTGNDLWYVKHSLDMLYDRSLANGKVIDKKIIDQAIYPRTESNNFAFLDAFFVDQDKALRRLQEAKESGVHWSLFLGAVYWGLKIIIQMTLLYKKGKTTSSILAKEVGGPPFTISRYLKFVPNLLGQTDELLLAREKIVQLDYSIKTGKVFDTSFRLEMKRIVTSFHERVEKSQT